MQVFSWERGADVAGRDRFGEREGGVGSGLGSPLCLSFDEGKGGWG